MIPFIAAAILSLGLLQPPAEPPVDVQIAEFEAVIEYLATLPPPPPPEPEPVVVEEPAPEPFIDTTTTGDAFLDCVRQRESGGNYNIYNYDGSGAAGAYQFMQGTWDSTAAAIGRGDLIGVDPATASPADQDMMARALYAMQGAAPWGGGCG